MYTKASLAHNKLIVGCTGITCIEKEKSRHVDHRVPFLNKLENASSHFARHLPSLLGFQLSCLA